MLGPDSRWAIDLTDGEIQYSSLLRQPLPLMPLSKAASLREDPVMAESWQLPTLDSTMASLRSEQTHQRHGPPQELSAVSPR